MDADSVIRFITERFAGVEVGNAFGYTFFYYDPGNVLPADRRFPFATMATQDSEHDQASNLSREGVYRLNIGVEKETYRRLLGAPPVQDTADLSPAIDFTELGRILPHPEYAAQSWICILSPTDEIFREVIEPLLAEAHARAVRKFEQLTRT